MNIAFKWLKYSMAQSENFLMQFFKNNIFFYIKYTRSALNLCK